jgi:perosamine synthetase
MLNARKTLFPLQNVSFKESLGLIGAALVSLVAGTKSTHHRNRFEASFAGYIGDGEPVGFPSGRSALAALLTANGVQPESEVLVTGLTCDAVPQAILAIGAKPRWVDIDPSTLAMNPALAQEAITASTKAIIVQHSFGIEADLEPFQKIACSNSIPIIEDCCLALGSKRADSSLIGSGNHDAFWSFEVTKTISAGWGGIALVKDKTRAEKVSKLRDSAGTKGRINSAKALLQTAISALNYRSSFNGWLAYIPATVEKLGLFQSTDRRIGGMTKPVSFTEYGAAGPDAGWRYLCRQLDKIENQLQKMRANNDLILNTLKKVGIDLPIDWTTKNAILLRIPILISNRQNFEAHMWSNGIDTGRWFDSPVAVDNTRNPFCYFPGTCPNGEVIAGAITNLPTHAAMSDGDLNSSVVALAEYFNAHPDESVFMTELSNGRSL